VAPHSITHQWVDEVLRHVAVDALRIFVSNLLSFMMVTVLLKLKHASVIKTSISDNKGMHLLDLC